MMHPLPQLESYTIRTYDIDCQRRLSIPALVRLMQETAMLQVLALKISLWDLEAHQLAWVLIRKRIDVIRLPQLGETISIHSCPTGADRVFTYRDFRVYDEAGSLIATACTTWLLMNTATRQMARIPADLLARFAPYFPEPSQQLEHPLDQLPSLAHPLPSQQYRVGWYDLDFVQHLNNTHFVKWMLEGLDEAVLSTKTLQRLDLLFFAEGNLRDELIVEWEAGDAEGTYLHRLLRPADHKILATGRSTWI